MIWDIPSFYSLEFVYYGYAYGCLTELKEFPGAGMEVLHISQKFRVGTRMLHPYPYQHRGNFTRAYPYLGYCATGVHNYISSGYGYECRTELTDVPVRVIRGNIPRVYPGSYTTKHNLSLTEVPGTGKEVLQV